jgi:pimeloyl-ACP methyl ester carboxylesterase
VLATITPLAALVAVNTVSVSTQTAQASGEQVVRLPGGDIHILQSGPPSAPVVLLLHGLGASTAWWDPVMPALQDLHVVRVDLLGHGRSAKPADGYRIAEQARSVGAALDHLVVRRATHVGHSTGGMVATSVAEQRPYLVAVIVEIDTGPRTDAFIGDSLITRPIDVPVVGQPSWRLRTDNPLRGALDTASRKVVIPNQIMTDIRDMTYRSFSATSQASHAFLKERPVPDRLAELNLLVLVIFGSEDRRWQPSSAQDYRRVTQARIEILNGVGHTSMFEDPDATAALIRRHQHDIKLMAPSQIPGGKRYRSRLTGRGSHRNRQAKSTTVQLRRNWPCHFPRVTGWTFRAHACTTR